MKLDGKKISIFSAVSGVLFLIMGFFDLIGTIINLVQIGFRSLTLTGVLGMMLYSLVGIALIASAFIKTKTITSVAFAVLGVFTLLTTFFNNLTWVGRIIDQIIRGYFEFHSLIFLLFGILTDILAVLAFLLAAGMVFGKDSPKFEKFEGMMNKLFWIPAAIPFVNFLLGILTRILNLIIYKGTFASLFSGLFTSFFDVLLLAAALFCGIAALYLKKKPDPLIVEPEE